VKTDTETTKITRALTKEEIVQIHPNSVQISN